MNLPNKLTIIRIIMTPFFLLAMLSNFKYHYLVALLIFVVASLTDLIDGKIARKYNLITDFGKFLDPLADKMLTTAAFLGFMGIGVSSQMIWITFIVLIREFLVTSIRLIAASSGKVIAANIWGKAKTVSQMVAIIFTLLTLGISSLNFLSVNTTDLLYLGCDVLLWSSAVLTVASGAIYLRDSIKYIDPSK